MVRQPAASRRVILAPWRAGSSGRPLWPLVASLEIFETEALAWPGSLRAGPWPEPIGTGRRRAMCGRRGAATSWLVAGISPRRRADEAYRDFLRLVGSNVAAALAVARRSEDERRRADALAELDRAKTDLLLQRQPRIPDAAVADASRARWTCLAPAFGQPSGRARSRRLETRTRNGAAPAQAGQFAARLLAASRPAGCRRASSRWIWPPSRPSWPAASAPPWARPGSRFVRRLPALAEPVYVDREMWEKIVLNLVSNAFKFTLAGEVAVSAARPRTTAVRCSPSSTPAPASRAELPRLFERFHRVEGARGRTHEGTGIGLALVQELVKMHGGDVRPRAAEAGAAARLRR